MIVYKCKMCGGNLNIQEGEKTAVCEYCGTQQTVPSTDDEKKANLFNRANHFRRNSEFDKAKEIYEHILDEDSNDAEVYWSIVLCKYGIEYVEDPVTGERKPTINRVQPLSILQDADYKMTLEHADFIQKSLYEKEAVEIDEIQKEILNIANNESPYDIFISYKEKATDGGRTQSSVLAQNIYQMLTKSGYRVFFSRISLEDKLGQKYEPYIYSALNSAKVMLVVGTEKEEFNAPWVKNEWARFLNMMQENTQKVLIPCFRNIDPYDLPDEFQMLQSQDMAKVGADQDLLHGIEKIMKAQGENKNAEQKVTTVANSQSLQRLLQNAETYIRLGNYEDAQKVYQKITELYPEDYRGWWGRIISDTREFTIDDHSHLYEWNRWMIYVKKLAAAMEYNQMVSQYGSFIRKISKVQAKDEIDKIIQFEEYYKNIIRDVKNDQQRSDNELTTTKRQYEREIDRLQNEISKEEDSMHYHTGKADDIRTYRIGIGMLLIISILSLLIGSGTTGALTEFCMSLFVIGIVLFGIGVKWIKKQGRVKQHEMWSQNSYERMCDLQQKEQEEKQKYDNKIKQIILAKDPYIKEEKSISNCIDLCKQYEKYGVEQIADIWAAMDLENIDETVQLKSEQMNLRKQIYDDARKYHAVNAEM